LRHGGDRGLARAAHAGCAVHAAELGRGDGLPAQPLRLPPRVSRMRMHRYTRRSILHSLVGAGAAGMLTGLGGTACAASAYGGKLLVNLQLVGALDVTSFADPKTNVPGKPLINNWAQSAEIRQAGNIRYAPFAQNVAFF